MTQRDKLSRLNSSKLFTALILLGIFLIMLLCN